MDTKTVTMRSQRVPLHRHPTGGFSCYQGGDYFEFRHDAVTHRWIVSQSAEDRLHDPAHVVAHGATIQDAADAFTAACQPAAGYVYVPTLTRGCDLAAASIDTLVLVLGEAVRLGYADEQHNHPRRTPGLICDALALADVNGLQQLQLIHAYKAGREHLVVERIRAGQ